MRYDAGVNGDAQRIEQLSWLLFLKVYDIREEAWEIDDDDYESIIPEKYQWRNWAMDSQDGKALTGAEIIQFVDNNLIPTLANLPINENTPVRQAIIPEIFSDVNNYMKDGVQLRKLINRVNALDLTDDNTTHDFNNIYETILKDLQSQRSSGEFYTPRALTDFISEQIKPKLGESIADLACGTGGFLISALKILSPQVENVEDQKKYIKSVHGIEKKAFPYLLAITNLLLHGIDEPDIIHGNSLTKNINEYTEEEKFDVIMMNPPFGGVEQESVQNNFPQDLKSSETADLFMVLIMSRLKHDGRAGVILPDGFLFSTDGAKQKIKRKLLEEFNLHTIVRLPNDVFQPYTGIHTNILFFDKSKPTDDVWFYRMDMPNGYKHFSKTHPIELKHFEKLTLWMNNPKEIKVDDNHKAIKVSKKDIEKNDYSLDFAGFSEKEVKILSPEEEMNQFEEANNDLSQKIAQQLENIKKELGDIK
ncbi:type I restriction-modification system subunit M [Apilactobacillus sp. TMW 2.2458]|nr:type I restriction-modification system subunit M [Apilactobacillus xinyiensis]